MTPRLPRWTAKQLLRLLRDYGFTETGHKGSHLHLVNTLTGRQTTVPVHAGKIIGPGLLKAILDQAGIPVAELE